MFFNKQLTQVRKLIWLNTFLRYNFCTAISILSLQIFVLHCNADSLDYYNSNYLRYDDFVYRSNIKTVLLEGAEANLTDAAYDLNSNQQLRLSFDELDAEINDYSYTVIHCDNNWQPSEINESQYLQGFTTDKIFEYKSSTTALLPYVHYELLFPNEVIKPTLSGNYILKVFETANVDSVILTKRFVVFDNKVEITHNLHAGTFADKRFTHQEIDFVIKTDRITLTNPYNDLHVVLQQNNRWDNTISNLKPLYVKDQDLDYNYDDENCFEGGNEFRLIDIRSIRYQSEHIKTINQNAITGRYEVELMPDQRVSSQRYSFQNDIDGKYLIKHTEGHNSSIDGDYVPVHFTLKMSDPEPGGNIYLFGALTNWKSDASNRLTYNDSLHCYEITLLLKQGYYNYQYVFVADGKTKADASVIEGSHYETENQYTILVYYRDVTKRYDELIGRVKFNSTGK